MVSYELITKKDHQMIYTYYPEDDRSSNPGIITFYLEEQKFILEKVAEGDALRVATVEEMNSLRDSINVLRKESGLLELTEEELPYPTYDEVYYCYASHVIADIRDQWHHGHLPDDGMVMWY